MSQVIELRCGEARARVAPHLGGRVTRCSLTTRAGATAEVLHAFPEEHSDLLRWAKGGIYPLVPYWGRIAQAQLNFGKDRIALRPHPDAVPHTLHGTAHQANWKPMRVAATEVTLRLSKDADEDWPWLYEAGMTIALASNALRIGLSILNASDQPMPAGLGLHPYLRLPDASRLDFSAGRRWRMTQDHLSIDAVAVPNEARITSQLADLETEFTHCFSEWPGQLELVPPHASSPSIRMTASAVMDHLVLHHPASARYVCAEPVSHTADAFNLATRGMEGTGARSLKPGESLSGWVAFTIT